MVKVSTGRVRLCSDGKFMRFPAKENRNPTKCKAEKPKSFDTQSKTIFPSSVTSQQQLKTAMSINVKYCQHVGTLCHQKMKRMTTVLAFVIVFMLFFMLSSLFLFLVSVDFFFLSFGVVCHFILLLRFSVARWCDRATQRWWWWYRIERNWISFFSPSLSFSSETLHIDNARWCHWIFCWWSFLGFCERSMRKWFNVKRHEWKDKIGVVCCMEKNRREKKHLKTKPTYAINESNLFSSFEPVKNRKENKQEMTTK